MASSKRSRAPRSKSARPAAAPPPRADRAITAAVPPPLAPAITPAHAAANDGMSVQSASWLREVLWTRPVAAPAQPPRPGVLPVRPPAEQAPAALSRNAAPAEAAPARAADGATGDVVASRPLSPEEHRRLVAKLAYVRAEGIGFGRSNPVEDWLWAEQEVKRMLGARAA